MDAHRAFYEALRIMLLESQEENLYIPTAMSKFWETYLCLFGICLAHQYAERAGKWDLYVQSLEAMIPLFSKWLSVHVEEMKALPTTAPEVHEEFLKGNFVVRRTTRRFSSVSPDMALEQTLNKDVKNHSGNNGIPNKDNARNKWFFTTHIKAAVNAELNATIEKD